jgi:uncharacterized membrane protein
MSVFVLGLVLFLGIHSVAIVGQRDRAVSALGEGPWKGVYSLISAVGLAAIAVGYGLARQAPTVVWIPPTATRHLALLVMVPVFPLLFAAYLPGRIRTAARHPMLLGTKLWATAHLLANGMLADLLLFGGFLVWAVAVRVSLKRRVQREIPALPAGWANDGIAVVGGLSLYVLTIGWAHVWLFGVSPR